MKCSEKVSDNPVILLKLAAIMACVALAGCNSGTAEKYEETKPTYSNPSHKVCTARELKELPEENETLNKISENWAYGSFIYFYIHGPITGFGPAKVVTSTLPEAAILMNAQMTAFENCNAIYSCVVEKNSDLPNNKQKAETCLNASRIIGGYISDVHTILKSNIGRNPYEIESGRPTPAEICPLVGKIDEHSHRIEVAGTSPYIEIVITKGIESLESMTDQSKADSFKSELKTLCGHYRQIDYCGLNKKEVYNACEKAFGTHQQ